MLIKIAKRHLITISKLIWVLRRLFYINCICFTALTQRKMFPYLNSITSFIPVGFNQGCAVEKSGQRCCRGDQDVHIYGGIQVQIVWVCDWLPPVGYSHNNSENTGFATFLVGHFSQMWHDLLLIFRSIWGSLLWRCGKSTGWRTYG